jgi:hypothetical protein
VLRRQVAYDTSIDNENIGNELFHEVSNFADTPYTTPQATLVMGAVGGNMWDDDNDIAVLTQEL